MTEQEYLSVCKKASIGMRAISKSDYKINNSLIGHSSVTYVTKNQQFHWYIEGLNGIVSFTVDDNLNIRYKISYNAYKEGTSSVILMYSDYAEGKSSWDISSYLKWTESHEQFTHKHALYYYTENFDVVDFFNRMQHKISVYKA